MSDNNSIALIGYSGHAYVVLEAACLSGMKFLGYCDNNQALHNPFNLKYLGFEGDKDFNWDLVDKFVLGLGENNLRYKVGELVSFKNKELVNVIHPTAAFSSTVKIGQGNFIGTNAIVNALATIDNYCILNSGSIMEHECKIGPAVHIAPGAILAGNVSIGQKSFIGANSVIKQGVKIGKNVIVGAGSTVIINIPDNQVWVGNPARRIK